MTTVKTLYGQTMLDITVQQLGDIERLFEVAVDNNISITDDLDTNSSLVVGDAESNKKSIVKLFNGPHKPASADTEHLVLGADEGIGFWYIENDFIAQ